MVDAKQVRFIIGIIGTIISPTFWRIYKKKSVEEFQPWPYVAAMMNCMLWVFYGLPVVHKDSILVTTINGVGMVFEALYISVFLIYCGGKKNIRRKVGLYLVAEVISVAAIVLITLFAIQNSFAKQTFVGVICDIFNIGMYAAPSLAIKKVIRTRSVEYMPFWLSFIGFINAAIWTAYSLIYKLDLYVLISNGLGTTLCASQLIVYLMYRNATPKDDGKTKPSEIEIPGTV
ncbi:unnamed protein product [Eruca vesicaria subsp. sativa]|uniref:Bidirectional sugar transporter SWEET n=1 Tax=Eruca vesicaria subsp. sativa TaxID=29727 RepID=A0ABC8IY13_ERUVS|nr:unnamed protein product [Eruca vesicaria subsp. sativa]